MNDKVILAKSGLTIITICSLILFLIPYIRTYSELAQLDFPNSDEANATRRQLESQMIAYALLATTVIGLTWLAKVEGERTHE